MIVRYRSGYFNDLRAYGCTRKFGYVPSSYIYNLAHALNNSRQWNNFLRKI